MLAFDRAVPSGELAAQRTLAERLFSELGIEQWRDAKGLYVVPNGDWHYLPWGILEIDAPVAVLPTGGWLARSLGTNSAGEVVILGDPDFAGQLPDLPGARAEAKAVAQLYRTGAIIGKQATESNLREALGNRAAVLHMATHGLFDAKRPLDSAIYLAGDGKPEALTAAHLFESPLNARLVVLSGCETGLGRAQAGADFLGLPRSFYLGGSLAVVSSLWTVEDEGTRLFMETFHRQARDGNFGATWLTARNTLREKGYPPFIYGAFVLGGALQG